MGTTDTTPGAGDSGLSSASMASGGKEAARVPKFGVTPCHSVLVWRWRHMLLSKHGPSEPSHRLVALTISLYMSPNREGCWVGQKTIAERVHLSERQVRRVLDSLEASGWIFRKTLARGTPNQVKRMCFYFRRLPDSLRNLEPVDRRVASEHAEPQPEHAEADSQANVVGAVAPAEGNRTLGDGGADICEGRYGHSDEGMRTPGCPMNLPSQYSQKIFTHNLPSKSEQISETRVRRQRRDASGIDENDPAVQRKRQAANEIAERFAKEKVP
jgi:hypothetical protein